MERYLASMREIIQLLDSSKEALNYLSDKFKLNESDPPLFLFSDVIDAVVSINDSLGMFIDKLPDNNIKYLEDALRCDLLAAGLAIQANDLNSFMELLDSGIINKFEKWQDELITFLSPFILC